MMSIMHVRIYVNFNLKLKVYMYIQQIEPVGFRVDTKIMYECIYMYVCVCMYMYGLHTYIRTYILYTVNF